MLGQALLPLQIHEVDHPGLHDFALITSDGVGFNLSRFVLMVTSNFFATVGKPIYRRDCGRVSCQRC